MKHTIFFRLVNLLVLSGLVLAGCAQSDTILAVNPGLAKPAATMASSQPSGPASTSDYPPAPALRVPYTPTTNPGTQEVELQEAGLRLSLPADWIVRQSPDTPIGLEFALAPRELIDFAESHVEVIDLAQVSPERALEWLCGPQPQAPQTLQLQSGLQVQHIVCWVDHPSTPQVDWFSFEQNGRLVFVSLQDPTTRQPMLEWIDMLSPLETAAQAEPTPAAQVISLSAFERSISLRPDIQLMGQVETALVPAIPFSRDAFAFASHPAYAQFRFTGYQTGSEYRLPLPPAEDNLAQVMVFRTQDFAGYGDDSPLGFVQQATALADILENGVEAGFCDRPLRHPDQPRGLPFLPWVNAAQGLCAQPEIVAFSGGQGLRYLGWYSQGPVAVLDQQVFYTFQGLSDDGELYVSAVFPITTGVFPTEPPAGPLPPDPSYWTVMADQIAVLNAQPDAQFNPTLAQLDALIGSLSIEQP